MQIGVGIIDMFHHLGGKQRIKGFHTQLGIRTIGKVVRPRRSPIAHVGSLLPVHTEVLCDIGLKQRLARFGPTTQIDQASAGVCCRGFP